MAYGVFLIIFVCVPLGGLVYLMRRSLRRAHLTILVAIATIAVLYTTPWDNYLVASGVWYYSPQLVLNITLGYVPLEEYLFFILQTFVTGLFALWLWRRFYASEPAEVKRRPRNRVRFVKER